jgi:hypothetical protein
MTYASEVSDNEYPADRWRVLKRFVNGVLYAKVDRQDVGTLYVDLAGMIAAACAMLVATLCLLFINSRWASNLSWAFVSAMVLSYVLKDRVKEWGRRNLGKRLSRSLADHQLRIRSASNGSLLGSCKETFSIQSIDDLPDEVSAMRCSDLATFDAVQGRPETVLCHTKEISLSSEALRAEFPDANGITDILRLNVSSFLSRMDDVWESYSYVHPESGELRTTRCARVYNLNIVLWMSDAQGKASLRRCRAVLNKKGLIRVETLSEKGDWTGGEVLVGRAFEDAALVVLGEDDA